MTYLYDTYRSDTELLTCNLCIFSKFYSNGYNDFESYNIAAITQSTINTYI